MPWPGLLVTTLVTTDLKQKETLPGAANASLASTEVPKPRLEHIMETLRLSIQGMSCGGCVGKVSAALKSVPGTTVDEVAVGSARVQFDPKKTTDGVLIAAVNKLGFQAAKA